MTTRQMMRVKPVWITEWIFAPLHRAHGHGVQTSLIRDHITAEPTEGFQDTKKAVKLFIYYSFLNWPGVGD